MVCISIYIGSVFVVITSIVIYLRWRFTYWSRLGVPGPNFIEWKALTSIHHEFTLKQIKKYGRIYGSYDLINKSIIINEPDLIRDIMVKDFHLFPHRNYFYKGSSKINSSLFFLPGNQDWKRIRSILSPSFTSGKLRSMMANISNVSDKFVLKLKQICDKGDSVDIRKYIGAFAMDVISACAYGIQIDSIDNPNHPIVLNAKKILNVDASLAMFLSIFAPPIAEYLKVEPFDVKAVNYFDELTAKIVKERKHLTEMKYKERKHWSDGRNLAKVPPFGPKHGPKHLKKIMDKIKEMEDKKKMMKRTDFLQLMINTERNIKDIDQTNDEESFKVEESNINDIMVNGSDAQNSGRTLSSDELTAQSILFFIAGYDTTSAAISHCIYFLSKNNDCQQKLYEELLTISDFSYETLNKLKYLNAVINETLRLAPSLTHIGRECIQDYKLGNTGITIPAGTSIEIYPYALHRDPELFPEPETFKPERFISESGEPTHHPYAYIPFGGGPRLCIGMRFALNEMRMCVAKLVNKFEFTLEKDFKIDYFNGSILLSPKSLMVHMKVRNNN